MAELVEVGIASYKNLHELTIPWTQRQVLYGRNGVGKSNLLEACALALGSETTLWNLARRAVPPDPGKISAVVRTDESELPLPPRWSGDDTFWSSLGADRTQRSWFAAVHSATSLPEAIREALLEAERVPTIRYRLEGIEGLDQARNADRGRAVNDDDEREAASTVRFSRRYSRALCLSRDLAQSLFVHTEGLPDGFAPLRRAAAQVHVDSAYVDFLELPPATSVPVVLSWLQHERTSDEMWWDLERAYSDAARAACSFVFAVDRNVAPPSDDAHETLLKRSEAAGNFWALVQLARYANDVLHRVDLDVRIDDQELDSLGGLMVTSAAKSHRLGDLAVLETMSGAQRLWLDHALLEASDRLSTWRVTLEHLTLAIAFIEMPNESSEPLHLAIDRSGYRDPHPDELDAVSGELGLALRGFVPKFVDAMELPLQAVFDLAPHAMARSPVAEVTLYDEPERHLHPAAARRLADALNATPRAQPPSLLRTHTTSSDTLPPATSTSNARQKAAHSHPLIPPTSRSSRTSRLSSGSQLASC